MKELHVLELLYTSEVSFVLGECLWVIPFRTIC